MINAKCRLFNCDKKHKNQCCYFCDRRGKCKNPCLNNPQKCGTAYSNKTLSKGYRRFLDYEIGKTVFLTREEAEQALKERESNA